MGGRGSGGSRGGGGSASQNKSEYEKISEKYGMPVPKWDETIKRAAPWDFNRMTISEIEEYKTKAKFYRDINQARLADENRKPVFRKGDKIRENVHRANIEQADKAIQAKKIKMEESLNAKAPKRIKYYTDDGIKKLSNSGLKNMHNKASEDYKNLSKQYESVRSRADKLNQDMQFVFKGTTEYKVADKKRSAVWKQVQKLDNKLFRTKENMNFAKQELKRRELK